MLNIVAAVSCVVVASTVAAAEWGCGAGIVVFSLCGFMINMTVVTVLILKENNNG